jgi:hypothetical protein
MCAVNVNFFHKEFGMYGLVIIELYEMVVLGMV